MLTASARISATAAPRRMAHKCSRLSAPTKPSIPGTPLATTDAAAVPPTRGCKIKATLMRTTGAKAAAAAIEGPSVLPATSVTPTTVMTKAARKGTSHARFLGATGTMAVENLRVNGMARAYTAMFSASALPRDHCPLRIAAIATAQTPSAEPTLGKTPNR